MKRSAIFAILLTAVVVTPMFAASPQTANLAVSARVISNCSIATSPVAFGDYDPTVTTATTATGSVDVRCTTNTVTTIDLGNGANYSGGRRMANGGVFLSYSLLQPDNATVWGSAAGGSTYAWTAPNAALTSLTVNGSIAPHQNATAGNYADTVVATISW